MENRKWLCREAGKAGGLYGGRAGLPICEFSESRNEIAGNDGGNTWYRVAAGWL